MEKINKLKFKNQKGITLIALIITVIVMLILAGVAISAVVDGDGLFFRTWLAKEVYENAAEKESDIIGELENMFPSDAEITYTVEPVNGGEYAKVIFSVKKNNENIELGLPADYNGYRVSAQEVLNNKNVEEKRNMFVEYEKTHNFEEYQEYYPGEEITWDLVMDNYNLDSTTRNEEDLAKKYMDYGYMYHIYYDSFNSLLLHLACVKEGNILPYELTEIELANLSLEEKKQIFIEQERAYYYQIDAPYKNLTWERILEKYNAKDENELIEVINNNYGEECTNFDEFLMENNYNIIYESADGVEKSHITDNDSNIEQISTNEFYVYDNGKFEFIYVDENGATKNIIVDVNVEKTMNVTYNDDLKQLKPGDYVLYDTDVAETGEIVCRVLYDANSEYGLQIISDCIKENGEYIEIELGRLEDRYSYIYDYNNAITILNNATEKYKNNLLALDSRCVGSNPVDKNVEAKTAYNEYNFVNRFEIKAQDENYITDLTQLEKYDMVNTEGDTFGYFFASRLIELGEVYWDTGIRCGIRESNNSGYIIGYRFDPNNPNNLIETVSASMLVQSAGLRACFLLKGDLKVLDGDGKTPETAYKLGV